MWKINFWLPVGFEPTTSGFRDQRLKPLDNGGFVIENESHRALV